MSRTILEISNNAKNLYQSALYSFFNEVKKRELNGEKIINLGVGLPYYDTPSNIKEAGIKAIRKGKTKYTPSSGVFELKKAISEKLAKEGLVYDASKIVISSGAKPLLASAQWALLNKGDKVIIPSPYYPPFVEVAKQMGAEVIFADMLGDKKSPLYFFLDCRKSVILSGAKRFSLVTEIPPLHFDSSALSAGELRVGRDDKISVKLLILNSPNNPTGKVYNRNELEEIAKFAVKNDLWVISDECYSDFVYTPLRPSQEGKHLSIASFPEMRERTVMIRSFSKSYAMTGWRVGYAVGPDEIMKKISMYLDNFVGCASSISQFAAITALENDDFTNKMVSELDGNRKFLIGWLDKRGIEYIYPEGAFYVFVKYANLRELESESTRIPPLAPPCKGGRQKGSLVKGWGEESRTCKKGNSVEVALKLLKRGVAVTPGIAFGDYDDYIRVSYAVEREKLEEAMGKIFKSP